MNLKIRSKGPLGRCELTSCSQIMRCGPACNDAMYSRELLLAIDNANVLLPAMTRMHDVMYSRELLLAIDNARELLLAMARRQDVAAAVNDSLIHMAGCK